MTSRSLTPRYSYPYSNSLSQMLTNSDPLSSRQRNRQCLSQSNDLGSTTRLSMSSSITSFWWMKIVMHVSSDVLWTGDRSLERVSSTRLESIASYSTRTFFSAPFLPRDD